MASQCGKLEKNKHDLQICSPFIACLQIKMLNQIHVNRSPVCKLIQEALNVETNKKLLISVYNSMFTREFCWLSKINNNKVITIV